LTQIQIIFALLTIVKEITNLKLLLTYYVLVFFRVLADISFPKTSRYRTIMAVEVGAADFFEVGKRVEFFDADWFVL
jgi:hypothetical protein